MSLRHAALTEFFRNIARRHPEIRHTADEQHFARLIVSQDPIRQLLVDEFLNSIKSRMKAPFMLYEAQEIDYVDNKGDNRTKLYHPAFILLDKPEKGNYNQQEAAFDRTERMGEEIMAYIVHTLRQRLDTNHIDINSIFTEKIGPIGDLFYGTRFNFQFTVTANGVFVYNPALWITGGTPPPYSPGSSAGNSGSRDYSPLAIQYASYTSTDADAFRLVPFDCSAGPLNYIIPTAVGRKGLLFMCEKIDASDNPLTVVSQGGSAQLNFGFPLQCLYRSERQKMQSNNSIYFPY